METINLKPGNIALFKREHVDMPIYFISTDGFSIVGETEQELINPPLFFYRSEAETKEEVQNKINREELDILASFCKIPNFNRDYKIVKVIRHEGKIVQLANGLYEKIMEFAYIGVNLQEKLTLINFSEESLK